MEQIKIKNLRLKEKGALLASFDLELTDRKVLIRDCALFGNHNGDWVNYPARKYEADGQTKYFSYFMLLDEDWQDLQKLIAVEARKEFNNAGGLPFDPGF